jgi:thiol-disulfide isomerase/thioredoxin
MKKAVIPLVLLLAFSAVGAEENTVIIKFFFTEDCDHCAAVKVHINELKEEYGDALTVEMVDVFSSGGYKEFKGYGFIMTPGVVINEQIKMEGDTTKEELREAIESFLTPKKVIIRLFYDTDNMNTEYQRIRALLSSMSSDDVGVQYLDYENNRNDFLYFGLSHVPSVTVNELSFEEHITEDLIKSAVKFYLEEKEMTIIGFYAEESEIEPIDAVLSSERYADTVAVLWVDVTKNSKEFYLEGFSKTPSAILNNTTKIQEVTKKDMVEALENLNLQFYTPLQIYFIVYPFLPYVMFFSIVLTIGGVVYLWRR